MARHILLVLSNAANGRDEEFNDWYTDVHLTDVLKVDGFVAAQRFRLGDAQLRPDQATPHRYLAVYEIEAEDVQQPLEALTAAVSSGAMRLSDTLEQRSLATYLFTPVSERMTAAITAQYCPVAPT